MSVSQNLSSPLADRMRPKTIEEFRGQQHLMKEGGAIYQMIKNDSPGSFILWGPPGTGKTTIAKLIAENSSSEFHQLNAVSSGVRDVREVIRIAAENKSIGKKTILFIDEIHRFNKSQQDALLSAVESGLIILIGATTENPSFEVIPALRSRVRIFTLNELTKDELVAILNHALQNDILLKEKAIEIPDIDFLIYLGGGDARVMLNIIEAALNYSSSEKIILDTKLLETIIQKKNVLYDKAGEEHYNVISAFIKSIRGSDPDAALYWMARMLEGGEDPLFIARRMLVLASEDIGNASPNALLLAEATFSAVDKIGMPEARIILAQCATYLASAPKSNAAYEGIESAFKEVRSGNDFPVPLHLRNAPTQLMKNLGYAGGYKYPHSFEGHFIDETYLPEKIKSKQFYFPSDEGNEKTMKERLKKLWGNKKKYR